MPPTKRPARKRGKTEPVSPRLDRKKAFIRKLAEFFAGEGVAFKSIQLSMGNGNAIEWAALRGATPLFGYPTVDEAEATLTDFLG